MCFPPSSLRKPDVSRARFSLPLREEPIHSSSEIGGEAGGWLVAEDGPAACGWGDDNGDEQYTADDLSDGQRKAPRLMRLSAAIEQDTTWRIDHAMRWTAAITASIAHPESP